MLQKRHYNLKVVDMCLVSMTVAENAIANKAFLQSKRASWQDPFFENFKMEIDHALQNYLGIDSAMAMRQATAAVKSIQKDALNDLAEVKVQIMVDLKKHKDVRTELLKQLGFASHHRQAQARNQEALINLLYQFSLHLTAAVRNQLISTTGVSDALLTKIVSCADHLKNANVGQEINKGNRKVTTQEAVNVFNGIYDTAISISQIATKFFKGNKVMQAQFNFSKISKGISGNGKSTTPDSSPEQEIE